MHPDYAHSAAEDMGDNRPASSTAQAAHHATAFATHDQQQLHRQNSSTQATAGDGGQPLQTQGSMQQSPAPQKRALGPQSKKSSRFIGVSLAKARLTRHSNMPNKWEVHIWILPADGQGKGRQLALGQYTNEVQAARNYDRAALAMKKKDAQLNFPASDYDQDPLLQSLKNINDNQRIAEMLRASIKALESEDPDMITASSPTFLPSYLQTTAGPATPNTAAQQTTHTPIPSHAIPAHPTAPPAAVSTSQQATAPQPVAASTSQRATAPQPVAASTSQQAAPLQTPAAASLQAAPPLTRAAARTPSSDSYALSASTSSSRGTVASAGRESIKRGHTSSSVGLRPTAPLTAAAKGKRSARGVMKVSRPVTGGASGKRDGKQGEVSSSRAARSAQRHRRATPAAQQIKQGTSAIAAQQPPSTQQAVQQQEEAQVKAQAAPRALRTDNPFTVLLGDEGGGLLLRGQQGSSVWVPPGTSAGAYTLPQSLQQQQQKQAQAQAQAQAQQAQQQGSVLAPSVVSAGPQSIQQQTQPQVLPTQQPLPQQQQATTALPSSPSIPSLPTTQTFPPSPKTPSRGIRVRLPHQSKGARIQTARTHRVPAVPATPIPRLPAVVSAPSTTLTPVPQPPQRVLRSAAQQLNPTAVAKQQLSLQQAQLQGAQAQQGAPHAAAPQISTSNLPPSFQAPSALNSTPTTTWLPASWLSSLSQPLMEPLYSLQQGDEESNGGPSASLLWPPDMLQSTTPSPSFFFPSTAGSSHASFFAPAGDEDDLGPLAQMARPGAEQQQQGVPQPSTAQLNLPTPSDQDLQMAEMPSNNGGGVMPFSQLSPLRSLPGSPMDINMLINSPLRGWNMSPMEGLLNNISNNGAENASARGQDGGKEGGS